MTSILLCIFFSFGLIIGSFLNVVILRFNTHKSFGGRSGCMVCQNKLSWYELVPVFSFIGLRGRCKNCKTKISWQYPIVEMLSGLIFVGLFLKFQNLFFFDNFSFTLTYAYYATMFSLLLVIATYDLKHKIIPDILSIFLGVCTFIGLFFFSEAGFGFHLPTSLDLLSGLFISLPFALMWLLSKGTWMGFGDAKLAIGLGWLLGASRVLYGVVFSFWIGAIVGILLMIFSKKHSIKSEIPFAPFLVLGTILAFFLELHIFTIGL